MNKNIVFSQEKLLFIPKGDENICFKRKTHKIEC